MTLILINLQSNQQIKLNSDSPLILGRENVEGCFDKRVSRNHGRITCTVDGKVRLAALHSNPCFFTRNGIPPVQQLNKNEEETLNKGDHLGLLPNAFWFKVTSHEENEIKNQPECSTKNVTSYETNQTIIIPENSNNLSSHHEVSNGRNTGWKFKDKSDEKNLNSPIACASKSESNSVNVSGGFGTPEFEKTKRLPLWMYEIDDVTRSEKNPNKHSLKSDNESKGKKLKLLSEAEIKKEVETKSVDDVQVEVEVRNIDVPSTSKIENVDEISSSVPDSDVKEEAQKSSNEKEGYESGVDEKDIPVKRSICQYEDKCYRKNPQHKLEFCHPGDSDYVPYEERPLCQYGAACYRRSEIHKIEFRHPPSDTSSQNLSSPSPSLGSRASSPLPAKRRRKNVIKQSFDYEDYDEYDLEDPFTGDASSDEYEPSSLESEEENDLDASREDDS